MKTNNFAGNIKPTLMKKFYTLLLFLAAVLTVNAQSGTLDPTFGDDGFVTTVISGTYNFANSTVVQPDGKIIVVGQAGEPATYKATAARYNTDGSLDTSFGNNGTLIIAIGNAKSYATDVAIQEDGKIVIAGYTYDNVTSQGAILRLNEDGSFDTSFGNQGTLTITTSERNLPESILILEDGKILVGGDNDESFSVLKLNTDGAIDTSFGVNGWAITEFDRMSFIKEIALQEDGKIVVGGFTINNSNNYEMAAARFNADGSIDSSFGSSGKLNFNIGNGNDFVEGVVVQADGKIVLGGHKWIQNNEQRHDFAMVRLNTDGSRDTTYGENGVATAQIVDGANYSRDIILQDDQKILLAGFTVKTGQWKFALLRFDVDGSLDESFGEEGTGMVSPDFDGRESYGEKLALQPDNKIIMVGRSYNDFGVSEMVVMRFLDGELSVNDNLTAEVRLYPNPAEETLTIELKNYTASSNLEIVDLLGKTVYTSQINQTENINVSQLAQGTYFVKIKTEGKSDVLRFVKK